MYACMYYFEADEPSVKTHREKQDEYANAVLQTDNGFGYVDIRKDLFL